MLFHICARQQNIFRNCKVSYWLLTLTFPVMLHKKTTGEPQHREERCVEMLYVSGSFWKSARGNVNTAAATTNRCKYTLSLEKQLFVLSFVRTSHMLFLTLLRALPNLSSIRGNRKHSILHILHLAYGFKKHFSKITLSVLLGNTINIQALPP